MEPGGADGDSGGDQLDGGGDAADAADAAESWLLLGPL